MFSSTRTSSLTTLSAWLTYALAALAASIVLALVYSLEYISTNLDCGSTDLRQMSVYSLSLPYLLGYSLSRHQNLSIAHAPWLVTSKMVPYNCYHKS